MSILYFIRISLLILLTILTDMVLAKEYVCPETPIKITIGEKTIESWFVWHSDENITFLKKQYYKYHPKTYRFDRWFSLSTGGIRREALVL
tara:strand:- start:269 stop:541 length:273 start_codon:yes stop_codon:yes gene_type:complete